MWIPYDIRASLKAETGPELARLSRSDTAMREFLVGFFLRNPVTQVWELDLVAGADSSEIPAGADLPDARLTFFGNDSGKLAEVIYRLPASSAEDALTRAHADFQRRLLRWQVEIGRGMAIAGWRIADMTHGARWRCTPFRPSAMKVDFSALGPMPADLAPFAELFQRARNAPDAASRLMAAFAILHAAQAGHAALPGCGAAEFRVTQEMLIHSGAMAADIPMEGLDLPALNAILRPAHDRLTTPDGLLAAVLDDLPAQRQLALLANLADLVAHRLIGAEIRARIAARPVSVPPPSHRAAPGALQA